jgi:hypothetical protein
VTRPFCGYQQLWPWDLTYLLKSLTLATYFEWHVLGLCYFTLLFFVTRPFCGYQQIWFCVGLLVKEFNLSYIFWMVCSRTLIFYSFVPCDMVFWSVPADLTLWLWPLRLTHLLKTLTLAISTRTLIYRMSVLWPTDLISWPWC